MSGLTIHDLPVELHLTILDFLVGDKGTLNACCLTCKLWRHQAQRNLFHAVDLGERSSLAFCKTVYRRPELVEFIREATLNAVHDCAITKPPTTFRPANLQLLRLVNMDVSNPWVLAVLSASRLSIRQLSLRHCYTRDIAGLAEFLRQMPNLKNVDIRHGRLGSVEPPPAFTVHATDLQSLSLIGGEAYDLHGAMVARTFLACPGAYTKLSILTIHLPCRYFDSLKSFLDVVGPRLRELDLGVGPDAVNWRDTDFPLSLNDCPNLLLLSLTFRLCPPDVLDTDYLFWVPALLASVHARTLRRIKLVATAMRAAQPADLAALGLPHIARVLAEEERFASVRRVLFHVVGACALHGRVVPYLKEGLAALDERGILRCVHEVRYKTAGARR